MNKLAFSLREKVAGGRMRATTNNYRRTLCPLWTRFEWTARPR